MYKILKDGTRRKIILLLNEKGTLSYTDLMETLGFLTTGLLNYHLKVLDDLIIKNETGQYTLTEKGKLASRLMLEFPEENRKQLGMKPVVAKILDFADHLRGKRVNDQFVNVFLWIF